LVIGVQQADGARLRILIVEDSVADAELVLRELRAGGVAHEYDRIDTRAQWDEAVADLARWDLVLLDYALPQLDTLELLRELAQHAPELPSIVVSGTITEESAVSALRAGARDFVTKQNLVRLVPAVTREVAAAADVRELRAAEEALDESEARFARLVENAQDIVMRYQVLPEPRYEYVSPSVTKILGYTPQQFYDDPMFAIRAIHPDDRKGLADAYAEDPERAVTCRVVAADGTTVWLDRRQVAIRDDQGVVVALETVARDVTGQIAAHEAVQSKERKFRAIFEGALDALLLADDDRVYVDANPAACELFGVPREEIVGRRVEDFSDGVPNDVIAGWTAFLSAGRQEGEFALLRPDGGRRDTEFRATANVKPGVHLSIIRDITERRMAQHALREADERVRGMLAELPLIVFSVPVVAGSGPSYVSPQAEALLGLPDEAWGEKPELFWAAVHADDRERIEAAQHLEQSANDFRMHRPDGSEICVHAQHRFLHDEHGTPTRYQGFLADITELTASREALHDSENKLRQSQKMEAIGQLAGGIAHDFNNLLTVINGYGDMALARCNGDEQLRQSITEMRRAGDRAAELTHQLLAFSRQQVLKPEIVDLNDVVSEHASMLSRVLGEDVVLRLRLNARDGYIEADPGQIAQVILNLAGNARDAMPDGGELAIGTATVELADDDLASEGPAGTYVMLEITDTGSGIDLATQTRIFEPFFTTKEVGKGTGLGLPTVLGIVQQSRGRVIVESKPGAGTTFRIYLPRVEAPAAPSVEREERLERGTENVLLVEDDEVVRSLIEDMLAERGYTVLRAESPSAALHTAATYDGSIDLLVTDVIMPEMNGRQLAEGIQAHRPDVRTLYMSGYTSDAILARGVLPEGMHFLQKPFTASQLGLKAREALT
jgi:two-component system cell cycle sensor histidine kinase/response regulator CckA